MALNVFSRLMPREENFTALFCEHTESIVRAAQELQRLINGDDSIEAHVVAIRAIEATADAVAKKIFIAANRTFNAPIDREDILDLANDLDDTVDLIEDLAKGIQRYGVRDFPKEMRAMADAVVRCAAVLREVMPLLDAITPKHNTIFALCEKVGQIEGEADDCFDAGLTRLRAQLRSSEIDTIAYIDRKELFELLEEVVDRCDDVANAIQTITAKHV
jgi:predicted phosphate transport protein (TIGR00153 family)